MVTMNFIRRLDEAIWRGYPGSKSYRHLKIGKNSVSLVAPVVYDNAFAALLTS